MAKLHEILAVEGDLDNKSKALIDEAITTFTKKQEHFTGHHRQLTMFDEKDRGQEVQERRELVTTVRAKLDYVWETLGKYYAVIAQKEKANQEARADLVVDGKAIAEQLPATLLLGLENRLKHLRTLYLAIPTLAPGVEWVQDPDAGKGVYRTKSPVERLKTAKVLRYKVLVEPTEKHPAQVEKWHEDQPVGKFTDTTWSGMITPAQKSDLLERIDLLLAAVKQARQRANQVEVSKEDLGQKLFDYIHTGVI